MNLAQRTDLSDLVPSEFHLSQNYPNPFSERTTIKFCIPGRTRVRLEVFNSEGLIVETLLDEEKDAGTYEIEFLSKRSSALGPDEGEIVQRSYVYRIQAGNFSEIREMKLLRQQPPAYPSACG
jgi:hypothetical protein